jgi:hypothetical protein
MLFLVLLVLGALAAIVTGVNASSVQLDRNRQTLSALQQAREGLVGWAASQASLGPGHLPCPDLDNDGDSEGAACGTAATRVGRLPWKTLGLPDLRDANGERLWYAVSRCFLERQIGTETAQCATEYRVNSDTRGSLTIGGSAPANEVVAIVFAPGAALAGIGQSRSGPGTTAVANYLEDENAAGIDDLFVATAASDNFNDTVLALRAEDLFPSVENAVRGRIARELVPVVEAYRTAWGGVYPFAAAFDGRPSTTGAVAGGTSPLRSGLLPVDQGPLTWASGCGGPTAVRVAGTGTVDSTTTSVLGAMCQVRVDYSGTSTLAPLVIDITLRTSAGAASGFFGRYCASGAVRLDLGPDNDLSPHPACAGTPAPTLLYTLSSGAVNQVTGTLLSSGAGLLTYRLTVDPAQAFVRLDVQPPVRSGILTYQTYPSSGPGRTRLQFPENTTLRWFFANDWHRTTLFQASPGCVPGGSCTAGLSVDGAAPGTAPSRAVIVVAGSALDNAKRALRQGPPPPSSDPGYPAYVGAYFERENNEADPLRTPDRFEARNRSSDVAGPFNDRVVTVAP